MGVNHLLQNASVLVSTCPSYRYCILLMSLFSIYTGILYNEFFSMPMAIFGGTRWKCLSHFDGSVINVDPRDCGHHDGALGWVFGQVGGGDAGMTLRDEDGILLGVLLHARGPHCRAKAQYGFIAGQEAQG